MESNPIEDYESLRKQFEEAGQDHVFKYYDSYSEDEQSDFLEQLRQIDLSELEKLYKDVCKKEKSSDNNSDGKVTPVEPKYIQSLEDLDASTRQAWTYRGAQQLNKGTVGLLLLAGGMGSRLGSSDPKGMYDIGLPSGKSLFQIISEKFLRVQKYATEICQMAGENCAPRYKCMLYVMTSNVNHDATVKYFKDNDYFGIKEDRVMFFMQSSLPTITFDGKIMFESKQSLSICPNGNGALFKSMATNQALKDSLHDNGVEYIHLVGVDNVLNKFLDPLQVGMTYENGLKGSSKYMRKAYPEEPVGLFVTRDDRIDIIEYSELGEEMANEKYDDGSLKFDQGNILNYMISVEMLIDICTGKTEALNSLYHCATKKIPEYSESSDSTEKPSEANGYKLELFIHEFMPYVEGQFKLLEGIREEEFAPVKNKEGETKDSPTTARAMISKLHASWIKKAFPDSEFKDEPSESFVVELPFMSTHQGENIRLDMVSKEVLKE